MVDDDDHVRIVADRDHIAFQARGAAIDLAFVVETARDAGNASLEALKVAAELPTGELLEGLDLPECYRYHEWCVAERETARRARITVLGTLVDRFADDPEAALGYARARVAVDPLAEAAHIAVMRLLARLGRSRDALKQYDFCRGIVEAQLGRGPSRELEVARTALGHVTAGAPPAPSDLTVRGVSARRLLVGRSVESTAIATALQDVAAGRGRVVLLFCGEPGIGKTRLLEEVGDQAIARGGMRLAGRAFEAEMVRPFGPWIDALRALPPGSLHGSLREDLAPLLPELGATPAQADRNRLFAAVARVLADRAAARGKAIAHTNEPAGPLVIALDDLQWFDEASVALLHYLARSICGSPVLVACAARAAEVEGNPPARALLRALEREQRLFRIDVAPLDLLATEDLVRIVGDGRVSTQVFQDGGGNPLYSIELARAAARGDGSAATSSLDALIADRLSRLDERAAELLPWAAALGHAFAIDTIAALIALPVRDLLAAFEELERHGVLRTTDAAPGGSGYDFAHDLVRRTAYRSMSEPRRRWVHLHIARTLDGMRDPEGTFAADVAHHAALGGDSDLAARACIVAGERCLRLGAYVDANRLGGSGLQHVERLRPEAALPLRLELLAVQVHSNQWLMRAQELESELSRVADVARQRGLPAEAARAYYLMSFVHNERGDFPKARAMTLEAAQASRTADVDTLQRQLANTGRCLALIERDIARADEFLHEAEALGQKRAGRTALEMTWGRGLVHAFDGLDEAAVPLLERAAALAELESDHWATTQALTRVARLALERRRPGEAIERCRALEPVLAKLAAGSEAPFIRALAGLSRLGLGDPGAFADVERALRELRLVDSKAHVAYVLNALAEHHANSGRIDEARRRAEEALVAAEAVGHRSEAAVARSRLALSTLDREAALALIRACGPDWAKLWVLSARARATVAAATERFGIERPDAES